MAGLGVSFLSPHTLGLELQSRKLIVLDVAGLPIVRSWYVAHRKDKRQSPAAEAFRKFLLCEGAEILKLMYGLD